MDKAIEKNDWTAEHFVAWTNRLGLFEETSCLIHGFRAWYDGDFLKAIHVLVPQVELGLRGIVARSGKPTTKADSTRPGVSVAIGIGDMLYNHEIGELIGPDLRLHFLTLFADARGLNLRNKVAHGLSTRCITASFFGSFKAFSCSEFGINWPRSEGSKRLVAHP
jgi:lysyl-tRNA synthetase, class I